MTYLPSSQGGVATRPRHGRMALLAIALLPIAICLTVLSSASAATMLYVDAGSVGGACSDSRTAEQVTQSTPWCSLGRAAAAAPSGSTVLVRGASYPSLTVTGQAKTS